MKYQIKFLWSFYVYIKKTPYDLASEKNNKKIMKILNVFYEDSSYSQNDSA